MAVRFSEDLARETYDAVLIGSGIGCLSTAALLALSGQKVLVLERHYEPGGFTHTFKRKGFEWDVGVHYVGMAHMPHSMERHVLDFLTGGRLAWAPMGSPYDRAIIDGETYDFVPGVDDQLARWIDAFPKEEQAIREYWRLVKQVGRAGSLFFMERGLSPWLTFAVRPFMRMPFMRLARRTTWDVLRELTRDERLITMLCTQCGDYGLPPAQSSFAIHAMVVNHYRHGGSYPHGGARRIHECITETIEAHGGVVAVKAPVEQILLRGRKAVGVRLESGVEIQAKRVISGAGVHNTFLHLLPQGLRLPFDLHGDLERVGRSMSHNCVYVGFDREAGDLGLPKFNYWLYDTPSGEKPAPGMRIPDGYFSFPSAKDPEWPTTHPGTATAQLIGLGDYDNVAAWEDKRWCRRGEDYEAMKEEMAQTMLERLYTLHPETRGHVAYHEVSTPLSTRHFANYDRGQIYGLAHTPERFALTWLRPHTPIGGLFLTGQDIVSAGVMGALFSGIVTASAVLRGNALKMVFKRQGRDVQETVAP